jgi:hypothetical protein
LTDEEEDQLPSTEQDLFTIDTISSPEELVGVRFQGHQTFPYPNHFYTYTASDIEVDDTHVKTKVQDNRLLPRFSLRQPAYLKVYEHLDRTLV